MMTQKYMNVKTSVNKDVLLDETILSELVDMVGEESMARMLHVFLTELKERLSILDEIYLLLESSNDKSSPDIDFEAIEIQAHTLKSCAGSFGASALFDWVKRLENAAKERDSNAISHDIAKIKELSVLTESVLIKRFLK